MLKLTDYKKKYYTNVILDIPERILDNGIYWLQGTNGSGKSTLLKSIAGIIDFQGNIVLNDSISLKKNPISFRQKVNFAEAEPLFPEFLTGMEMTRLFLKAKSAPKDQEKVFIQEMGMQGYINDPLGTYSSGMLKKLSLVLAFLGNPEWILLDEPLITIDTDSLKILYSWIANKQEQDHTSFILASHQDLDGSGLLISEKLVIKECKLKSNSGLD